jgi:hypothetical protein
MDPLFTSSQQTALTTGLIVVIGILLVVVLADLEPRREKKAAASRWDAYQGRRRRSAGMTDRKRKNTAIRISVWNHTSSWSGNLTA